MTYGGFGQPGNLGRGTPGAPYPPGVVPHPALLRPAPLDVLDRRLATWWQRAGALLIDMLVVWVPGAVTVGIVFAAATTTIRNPDGAIHTLHPYT